MEEFIARDGGSAALHDDEASGDVGEVCSLKRRCAGSESESVGGENGVTRASDVDSLVAAMNRNEDGRLAGLKKSHAIAAASDEKRRQLHFGASGFTASVELGKIFADGGVMKGFEFGFVGSSGGDANLAIVRDAIAGVEGDGKILFAAGFCLAKFFGGGNAETIIGNGEGIGFLDFCEEGTVEFAASRIRQRSTWLIIHAKNLLTNGVGPTSKETSFGRSGPARNADDAGEVHFFLTEDVEELVACGVIAHGSDGENFGAESNEIVGGIGSATRDDLGFAVAKDEDRSFTGYAADFTELEGVSNKIAEDHDRLGRKMFDIFRKSEQVDRRGIGFSVRCAFHGGASVKLDSPLLHGP